MGASPSAARPPRAAANRPSANSRPPSPSIRAAIGSRPAARGSDNSHTWQSSSQSGTYSHVVNGVTLAGSFSQSASQDDTSSYTTGGSAGRAANGFPAAAAAIPS